MNALIEVKFKSTDSLQYQILVDQLVDLLKAQDIVVNAEPVARNIGNPLE